MTTEWKDASEIYLNYFRKDTDRLRREFLDPLLFSVIEPTDKVILDLGCGEGYLTRELKRLGAKKVIGADIAKGLVQTAQAQDPRGDYRVFDVNHDPVFEKGIFNAVVANMVLMDMPNLAIVYEKIANFLKPGGSFIASIVNPYYGYPVGVWKRDLREFFKGNFHPVLKISNYFDTIEQGMTLPETNDRVRHFHWKLSDHLNNATNCGFQLTRFEEPRIPSKLSERYKGSFLTQQLSSVPLYIILGFTRK